MKFGDLTYEEIKDCAEKGWLAIAPTGCTEQQGPHLPVDFDTWFAEEVCLAASEKLREDYTINSLVLPTMPFGPTPEHASYGSGYININHDLHVAVIFRVLKSLAEQGFRRIVVWRGCGQHEFREMVTRFNREFRRKSRAYLPDLPYHDIWMRIGDPKIPGGHADSFTTSLMLYHRPEMVHKGKIINPNNTEVEWDDPNLDFGKYSATGVIGDPTQASAELGKKLWETIVGEVTLIFKEAAGVRK